ncbi:hypothetical protein GCM10020331_067530 [Ectobacillus funiculus]
MYYLQNEVAYGQIVRGMHHWGASLVIVMMFFCTPFAYFFTGSYKKPRELNWIIGVLIFFGVMMGLGFTGYLLPWDMKALFATKSRFANCRANTADRKANQKHCSQGTLKLLVLRL